MEQITEVVFTLSQKHCPTAGRLEHLKRLPFLFLFFIITTDEDINASRFNSIQIVLPGFQVIYITPGWYTVSVSGNCCALMGHLF